MKLYTLISLGILVSLYTSSCSEDKIVNTNPGVADPELKDFTIIGKISNETNLVENWNAGDAFTLWNNNLGKGYNFSISENYNSASPNGEAEFVGQTSFTNDPYVLAFYPKKDVKVLSDLITTTLPDTCKSSEYRKNLLMTASAKAAEGSISELKFNKISSSLKFNLHNTADKNLTIAYVTLKGLTDVFPKSVKFNEKGGIDELLNANKVISIDMEDATLPVSSSIEGHTYVLPTTNGSQNFLKSNTPLEIVVSLKNGEQLLEYEAWSGTANELPFENNISFVDYSYQLCSDIEYVINVMVNDFNIPENGYTVDANGNLTIYNSDGLKYFRDNSAKYINSNIDIDARFTSDNTISIDQWISIPTFNGTFNGNGVVLKGVKEFVGINNGVIKNVTLTNNALVNENSGNNVNQNNNALLAQINRGTIDNCYIQGETTITISGTDGNTGALVGFNDVSGVISNSTVYAADFTINAASQRVGAIAGLNWGKVINCTTMKDVSITYNATPGTACLGGLIGLNSGGIVTACRSFAQINTKDKNVQAGGLIGSAWSDRGKGQIGISYAIPTITANANKSNIFGLIGAISNDGADILGCYSVAEGYGLVPSGATGTITASYYVGTSVTSGGENAADNTALQSHIVDMNNSVLGSGYKYENGKDVEPLVITSENPGTEGPDLGEGGEI